MYCGAIHPSGILKNLSLIYLTVLGLSCSMQTLSWGIWDLVP